MTGRTLREVFGVLLLTLSLAHPCRSEGLRLFLSTSEGPWEPGEESVAVVVWRGEDAPKWFESFDPTSEGLLAPDHQCREGEQVAVIADGLVGGPVAVSPEIHCLPGGRLPVDLVPAGSLAGRVEVEGARVPAWAWVEAETCPVPREPVIALGRFPVVLDDDGLFSVVLPAGCLRWRLGSPGLWSTAQPDLRLGEQQRAQAGTVTLRPAGRVEVEVRDRDAGVPVAAAEVRLVPEDRLAEVCDADGQPRSGYVGATVTGSSGWVEFPTVAPGNHLVVVTSRDHAPGLGPLVRVVAGETTAATVMVGPPGSVMVELGDLTLLAEAGRQWSVEATPIAGEVGIHSCAHRLEFARGFPLQVLENLAAGSWQVELLLDIHGTRFKVGERVVDIPTGMMVEADLGISENVVRGRIEYRREPVQGRFNLMSRGAPDRFNVFRAETRQDGVFVVLVPEPGSYDVHLRPTETGLGSTVIPAVEFPCDGSEVVIRVPEGRIEGRVVETAGDAVPGASVRAMWLGADGDDPESELEMISVSARTDEGGAFEMEGLIAGSWQVSARDGFEPGARRANPEEISLEEGGKVRDVILVLQESHSFKGRVVTPAGRPVGHVRVIGLVPPPAPGLHGDWAEAKTNADGSFEIPLGPTTPPWVNLQVGSPPLATVALRAPVTEDTEITLPDQGGTVLLRWPPEGTDRRPPAHEIALVSELGGVIGPTSLPLSLLPATDDNPEPGFEIGPLAPGTWRVLRAPATQGTHDALWAGGGGLSLVAVVSVFPGSVTSIER